MADLPSVSPLDQTLSLVLQQQHLRKVAVILPRTPVNRIDDIASSDSDPTGGRIKLIVLGTECVVAIFGGFLFLAVKVLGVGDKVLGMTVQDDQKVMPQTAATRSRFMITDILSGPADGAGIIRGRSPSPGPRDLSLHSNPIHDSDTDSSGHPDTSSICSNGEYDTKYYTII